LAKKKPRTSSIFSLSAIPPKVCLNSLILPDNEVPNRTQFAHIALARYKEMAAHGLTPNVKTLQTLICGMGADQDREVISLLIQTLAPIYGIQRLFAVALRELSRQRNFNDIRWLLDQIDQNQLEPQHELMAELVKAHAVTGNTNLAVYLLRRW